MPMMIRSACLRVLPDDFKTAHGILEKEARWAGVSSITPSPSSFRMDLSDATRRLPSTTRKKPVSDIDSQFRCRRKWEILNNGNKTNYPKDDTLFPFLLLSQFRKSFPFIFPILRT